MAREYRKFSSDNPPRIGQRVRHAGSDRLADVVGVSAGEGWATIDAYTIGEKSTTYERMTVPIADLLPVPGRPYVRGIDPDRAVGVAGKATCSAAPVASAEPVSPTADIVDALRRFVEEANGGKATEIDADMVREIVREEIAALPAPVVARVRKVSSSGTGKGSTEIERRIAATYTAGEETPVNLMLLSPPGYGKSFSVRRAGTEYARYFEHVCSEDMDEIATLKGEPVPDGAGGFRIVDGVVTSAMRAASNGETVLLFLDEFLRLAPTASNYMLGFLTGVTRPDGSRGYRWRTRRIDTDGALEMLECDAKYLHIVAAGNLEQRRPGAAIWDRFLPARFDFSRDMIAEVSASILATFGVADADGVLANRWAHVVELTRKGVESGALAYPASVRQLERAAAMSDGTRENVATLAADILADTCAKWTTQGDTQPESLAEVASIAATLRSL